MPGEYANAKAFDQIVIIRTEQGLKRDVPEALIQFDNERSGGRKPVGDRRNEQIIERVPRQPQLRKI